MSSGSAPTSPNPGNTNPSNPTTPNSNTVASATLTLPVAAPVATIPASTSTSSTSSAPAWIPDEDAPSCQTCANKFTLLSRRHHCRSCGAVVCADCSRVRANLRHVKDREVRLCVECVCELTAKHDSLPLPPLHQFIDQQLRIATFHPDKLRLTVAMKVTQAKMRQAENQMFEQTRSQTPLIPQTSDDKPAPASTDNKEAESTTITTVPSIVTSTSDDGEASSKTVVAEPAPSASPSPSSEATPALVMTVSPSSSPLLPPAPSPFVLQMKSYASEIQSLQSRLNDLQLKEGFMVEVILQNINSSAQSEVWNNQTSPIAPSDALSTQSSALNAGLHRYLLVLPPPYRCICLTSLLFPPSPSTFNKRIQPNAATQAANAIQNQLNSMQIPPALIEGPIVAAKEFFNVFNEKSDDDSQSEGKPPSTGPESVKSDGSNSDASAPGEPSKDSGNAVGTESSSTAPTAEASSDSTSTSPSSSSAVPTAAPTAPPASNSSVSRLRFYGIRSLDSISSIRPMDFRHDKLAPGSTHRGFTINFHPASAPTPSGLPEVITNRRDEDVLSLYRQSWNCIIVDDMAQSMHSKFHREVASALKQQLEEQGLTDVEANPNELSLPPAELSQSSSASPAVVSSKSTNVTPSSSTAPSPAAAAAAAAAGATEGEKKPTDAINPSTQLTDASTPSSAPPTATNTAAPVPVNPAPLKARAPSPATSFFSSILSVFKDGNNNRKNSLTNSTTSSTSNSTPSSASLVSPLTAAQLSAAAELSFQVQQEVISSIHACSLNYYAALIQQEKKHVQSWIADMKTSVSWDDPEHDKLLHRLWNSYSAILANHPEIVAANPQHQQQQPADDATVTTPTNPVSPPPFPGRTSELWKLLGFQGTSPLTDFRGVGLLSLKLLVYLGERYQALIDVLMSLQSSQLPQPREYPLACAGINLVCAIVNVLELDAAPAGSNMSASQAAQAKAELQGPASQLLSNLNQTFSSVTARLLNRSAEESPMLAPVLTAASSPADHWNALVNRLLKNRLFRLFIRHKSNLARTDASVEAAQLANQKRSESAAADGEVPPVVNPVPITPSSNRQRRNISSLSSSSRIGDFDCAPLRSLDAIDSLGELLAVLFPLLDDLWVEEQAGYFDFNRILKTLIRHLETVLQHHPYITDFKHVEKEMRECMKKERGEREKRAALERALQQAQVEKQTAAAKKQHHHHHPSPQQSPPNQSPQPVSPSSQPDATAETSEATAKQEQTDVNPPSDAKTDVTTVAKLTDETSSSSSGLASSSTETSDTAEVSEDSSQTVRKIPSKNALAISSLSFR